MNPICMSKHPDKNNTWCERVPDHEGPHRAASGLMWGEAPDLMDGGVTAAQIEKEAEQSNPAHDIDWQDVAERHEDTIKALIAERDEAQARTRIAFTRALEEKSARQKVADELYRLRATEPRSLTPDDITDQFVDYVHKDYFWSTSDRVRLEKPALKHALVDAVTRSTVPTRPEGAEAEEDWRIENLPHEYLTDDQIATVADLYASRGVRVTGDQS